MEEKKRFIVSTAPHIHDSATTARLMLDVLIALLPCVIAGIWLFGLGAARTLILSTAACVIFELLWQLAARRPVRVGDLSAAVTGLILGLNLPSTAPWWMILVGALVAVVLVKQLFGGIGDNFVNPALMARAVLLASWPAHMTAGNAASAYVLPFDAVSSATLLTENSSYSASMLDMFLGRIPGSIGEVCKIAILLGLAYLLIRRVISWHIPVTMLASFALFSWLFGGDPLAGLLSGGLLFGAVFMATDYVTSPMTGTGKLVYAAGAGLIVALIRHFGSYPEGVTYAILLMNICTPLIDRACRRRIYGEVKADA
ncbi:MAG: RnfABCDGE type electron transport complex subunit D [Clostridia bacterium]|nr:RnfABCDGE type electron transport complex subunit D [Clostridia bacterium]